MFIFVIFVKMYFSQLYLWPDPNCLVYARKQEMGYPRYSPLIRLQVSAGFYTHLYTVQYTLWDTPPRHTPPPLYTPWYHLTNFSQASVVALKIWKLNIFRRSKEAFWSSRNGTCWHSNLSLTFYSACTFRKRLAKISKAIAAVILR
jgi:hypothetical protein